MRGGFKVANRHPKFVTDMLLRDQHINRRNYKESKDGPEGHARNDRDANGIPGGGPGATDERQREMAADGRRTGHENGAEAHQRGLPRGLDFAQAAALE